MSDNLIPRLPGSVVPPRGDTRRQLLWLNGRVGLARAEIEGQSKVGEWAVFRAVYMKDLQRDMEQAHPDATEAIAIIINATLRGMLRSVENFNVGLD